MIAGIVAPLILTRYWAFPLKSENLGIEAMKWVGSLPAIVFTPITFAAGTALGVSSAIVNRMKRGEKERKENTLVQKT
ncbi:MAG: hypothetical protein AABX79_02100, partial [Nanoarchaeota archaeon]